MLVASIAAAGPTATKIDGRPFNPSLIDLPKHGYVEEEFFISGHARTYDIPRDQMSNATPSDATHPVRTRLVVRRPISQAKFNGTVVVEWTNVSEGFDNEVEWFHSGEHFVRSGYAWVGVSAQNVGVAALKQRMPERYASLDVTDNGTVPNDALSYDIFTAAGMAVRGEGGQSLMGGLRVERLIASGHSQSAGRLAAYFNTVHRLSHVYDAVLLHGGGGRMRTDLTVKIWKLLSETDVIGQLPVRRPDSDKFGTWEVAGTSHLDYTHALALVRLGLRSKETMLPLANAAPGPYGGCTHPPLSRIPSEYVQDALYDQITRWLRDGTPPPSAPPIDIVTQNGKPAIDRDSFGNALGGIRLAEHAVATALNSGENGGGGFCFLAGTHEDFDAARLAKLYSSHERYVASVKYITEKNLRAGYIVKADALKTIAAAEQSSVGRP